MRRDSGCVVCGVAVAALMIVGGCASSPEPAAEAAGPIDAVAAAHEPEAAAASPSGDVSSDRAAPDGPSLEVREDGRPSWWLDEPRLTTSSVRLCAEALGESMRDANARAVEAARARLVDLVEDPDAFEVERTWVWPTPHRSSGGARYAAFVLVTATR